MSVLGQQLAIFHINSGGVVRSIPLLTGQPIFILGRNGTGKSALVHNFVQQVGRSIYIPGSRPTYFDSDSLSLTPASRRQLDQHFASWDRQQHTRYRPTNGTQRNEKAVHDLQAAELQFKVDAANEIINLADHSAAITRLRSEASPLDKVNALFAQATLPVRMIVSGAELMAQRGGEPYSIARMSDGERAALILCAEIVSALPGSIFLIDEPELHLHRSIVVPLIRALIDERSDCAFAVSTHELELPSSISEGLALLVRGCTWSGEIVQSWDIDLFPMSSGIPEDLTTDIIGSRRKILFVEGIDTSLDQPLYGLLFPDVSIRPKGTARDVIYAVRSLRDLQGLHHATVRGLIDDDDLTPEAKVELESDDIYPLQVSNVESLYYGEIVIRGLAEIQGATFSESPEHLVETATRAALTALRTGDTAESLAARRAERKLRSAVLSQLPDRRQLKNRVEPDVVISVPSMMEAERQRLQDFISRDAIFEVIENYPVRYSTMLDSIARALHFLDRHDFESAALTMIGRNALLRDQLRSRLSPLSSIL